LTALDSNESPGAIRPHLKEALDRAPKLRDVASWWVSGHLYLLGGWQVPERRLVIRATVARAWPERGRSRSELFSWAAKEAFEQHRWGDAIRLGRGLFNPTALGVVARAAYRYTPFARRRR
jgi:hypothetical protein